MIISLNDQNLPLLTDELIHINTYLLDIALATCKCPMLMLRRQTRKKNIPKRLCAWSRLQVHAARLDMLRRKLHG